MVPLSLKPADYLSLACALPPRIGCDPSSCPASDSLFSSAWISRPPGFLTSCRRQSWPVSALQIVRLVLAPSFPCHSLSAPTVFFYEHFQTRLLRPIGVSAASSHLFLPPSPPRRFLNVFFFPWPMKRDHAPSEKFCLAPSVRRHDGGF